MGFEGCGTSKMLGLGVIARHERSKRQPCRFLVTFFFCNESPAHLIRPRPIPESLKSTTVVTCRGLPTSGPLELPGDLIGSFPDKRGIEDNHPNHSLEASRRLKLDMENLKECGKTKKKQPPNDVAQSSLTQEILQLEKRLQDQVVVRCALEKALGFRPSSHDNTDQISLPKPATELINEITVLELEVVHLEQYLLSLYQKALDQKISSISPSKKGGKLRSPLSTPRRSYLEVSRADIDLEREIAAVQAGYQFLPNPSKESHGLGGEERLVDSGVQRCHSSLSQRSALSTRTSPPAESLDIAVRACHSQPLSMMEYAQNASSNVISLAKHLGTHISDLVPETPNNLSEDMIKVYVSYLLQAC